MNEAFGQKATAGAVTFITDPAPFAAREALYLAVREREGRLYPDEIVRQLPQVPAGHPLQAEWRARCESYGRLQRYLARQVKGLRILDLGCGNGWLAYRLSRAGHTVWAMDLNRHELEQGARVFGTSDRLRFLYADIFDPGLPLGDLDAVVIAAAVQYFPDLEALLQRLFSLLKPNGEVHLVDTHFYASTAQKAAQERTLVYYSALGFSEMSTFYHHHTAEKLALFGPSQRNLWWHWGRLGRWIRRTSLFPWYVIRRP